MQSRIGKILVLASGLAAGALLAGRVVRAQRSWIWSRSGEEHGCVGCHEDRALAPENRWPMALRRFDTPTRLDLATHPVTAH